MNRMSSKISPFTKEQEVNIFVEAATVAAEKLTAVKETLAERERK